MKNKLSEAIHEVNKQAPARTLEDEIKKVFEESPTPLPRTTDTVMKVSQGVLRKLYPGIFNLPLTHNLDITIDDIKVTVPVNLKNMGMEI